MRWTRTGRGGRSVRACLAIALAVPTVAIATAAPAAAVSGLSIQAPRSVDAHVGVKFHYDGKIVEQGSGPASLPNVRGGLRAAWKETIALGPIVQTCSSTTCSLSRSFTVTATPPAAGLTLDPLIAKDPGNGLVAGRGVQISVT